MFDIRSDTEQLIGFLLREYNPYSRLRCQDFGKWYAFTNVGIAYPLVKNPYVVLIGLPNPEGLA